MSAPAGKRARPALPFLELARSDAELIRAAVAKARSPYQTLALLGYGGDRARAEQLVDAIVYFGWPTAHWVEPLPSGLKPVRDFSALPTHGTGQHGEHFEAAFETRLHELLTERHGGGKRTGQAWAYGPVLYFPEAAMEAWAEHLQALVPVDEASPWDGVVWDAEARTAVLWEVKATAKSVARLRRQLRKREAEVRALRAAGWTVTVAVVVGRQPLKPNLRWVRELRAEGVALVSLSELELP